MAVAFRSVANTTYASRTNTTVTAPAGIVDGDILLLYGLIGQSGSAATMTPPAGFAAVTLATGTNPIDANDGSFHVNSYCWWKRAASEVGNYTITHGANTSQAICMAISGAIAAGTPTDACSSNSIVSPAGNNTAVGLAVTLTTANDLLVFFAHDWGDTANNLSPPAGMTERVDVAPLSYAATQAIAATGTTGTRTMTMNNTNASGHEWGTFMVSLKPAVSVAMPPFRRSRRFFTKPF
jgi:hypothetical protein